jgi:hypothetical protein
MAVTAKPLINSKYAANVATLEYTAPASTRTIIDKFTATNNDASARTVSVYIVPSGGSPDNSNKIIGSTSISAGAVHDFSELQNQILATGDQIHVLADAASKVAIRASGRECT